MRKIMIVCLFFGQTLTVISCGHKEEKKTSLLPSFDLLLSDSTTKFNTAQIPEGQPIVLLYFSPDCEHCQQETNDLLQNMDSLKQVRFYFITNDPFDRLQVYNKGYKLYKYPNITLARDYSFYFPAHFKDVSTPYMVIYDKHKQTRGIFPGAISSSNIISFINTL